MTSFLRGHPKRWLFLVYLVLLLASHVYQWLPHSPPPIPPDCSQFSARAVRDTTRQADRPVRLVYKDLLPEIGATEKIPVLLLHGSPGSLRDFRELEKLLARDRRVIAPGFPGFGRSQRDVPDYSTRADADYCLQLLDALGIQRVHLVAFSMGGGVALNFYDRASRRVASLSMVGSIGVQELELLGNYELNHIIHGVQLVFLWGLEELTPHFGWLDDDVLSAAYARNFFDTDQRPFRGILRRFQPPVLIIHARDDSLVPFAAAREHHRLVPQSELDVFPSGNHFILWSAGQRIAADLDRFFGEVEAGKALTRKLATPERIAAAAEPFSKVEVQPAEGLSLFILLLLIVIGTFITEDITCITTGLLIAHGRLPLAAGFAACFLGIYLGDQLLYLAGRVLGRSAVHRAPWKWIVHEEDLRLAASWFERRGMMVILLSRFIPGTRLPTYLLAGAVRARYWLFALYFFVAVALWTPLLLGLTLVIGERAAPLWAQFEHNAFWVLVLTLLTVMVFLRGVIPAFTHRGRRLLLGRWRRLTRSEFWPPWAIYPPVALKVLALCVHRGGFTRVTAVNPAIHLGGLVGESKGEILRGLSHSAEYVATTHFLPHSLTREQLLEQARGFMAEEALEFPIVLKPDRGQRSRHVFIVRSLEELDERLTEAGASSKREDLLLQEYVAGPEYGVFYRRFPGQEHGEVLSITEKQMPRLVGDGKRRLEELILDDKRAVCMARAYMTGLADRLFDVIPSGESIQLVELGSHCRGSIFLDGGHLLSRELQERIDLIARRFEGFYFGRFDLRAESEEALKGGRDFKILELNGLTGEATHFYDPRYSVLEAWRVLTRQWTDAFAIADANIARGARPASRGMVIRELLWFLVHRRD
jgi:pimeloyl-ACP methyl ester carboxylesterase/membrane protein DedA with SNARE-associated domain